MTQSDGITFYVFYHGKFIDTMGPHWGLRDETSAAEKYRSLHPEMERAEIKVSRHTPSIAA